MECMGALETGPGHEYQLYQCSLNESTLTVIYERVKIRCNIQPGEDRPVLLDLLLLI